MSLLLLLFLCYSYCLQKLLLQELSSDFVLLFFRVLPDAPRLPPLPDSSNRSYESPYHHDSLKRITPHQHSPRRRHRQVSTDSYHSKRKLHHKNGTGTVSENGHAATDSDFSSDSDSKSSATKNRHKTKDTRHRATDRKTSKKQKQENSESESGMSESTTRHAKKSKSRQSAPKEHSSRKRRLGVVATKSDSESSEASVTIVPRNSLRRKSMTSQESEDSRPKKMYRVKKSQ